MRKRVYVLILVALCDDLVRRLVGAYPTRECETIVHFSPVEGTQYDEVVEGGDEVVV